MYLTTNTIGIGMIQLTKINQPKIVLHLGYSYSGNPAPAACFSGAEFKKLVIVRISINK
jgi:hypothetical protein